MPGFAHNLVGIGGFCDEDCTVTYTKTDVTIYDPSGVAIVRGWREPPPSELWRMSVVAEGEEVPKPRMVPGSKTVSLAAFSAYDLPSVAALVRYFHAAAGYPV